MKPVTKTLLIVLGCLALIGALIGGGTWYVASKKDEWLAQGKAIREDALKAGASSAEPECLAAAMTRYRTNPGIGGALGARVWLAGCLEASKPDSGFCDGVPPEDEIMASAGWRLGVCRNFGMESDSTCANVPAEVQSYCHGTARAQKRSAAHGWSRPAHATRSGRSSRRSSRTANAGSAG